MEGTSGDPVAALRRVRDEGIALFDELEEAALCWRSGGREWSILHCFEHLTMTVEVVGPVLATAIEAGAERPTSVPLEVAWRGRWLVRWFEPPPRFRFRAPPLFRPAVEELGVDATRERFGASHGRMVRLAVKAQGRHLDDVLVVSPINRFMKLRIGTAFAVVAAHGRRHLWQIERMPTSGGFPA